MNGTEMTSLNKPLLDDFSIKNMEARLETVPLMFAKISVMW